jgi:hypothetical protein
MSDETNPETSAEELTDELARKYDPERLLKLFAKRAGRGESLDHSIRAKYEKRFGVDLGHVRIVTGEFAEEFNRQREAFAVTVGGTGLVLMGNSPEKAMGTRAGEALLAHELTHVAQAQRGLHRRAQNAEMQFTEEHEVEAHAVEHDVEHEGGQGASRAGAEAQKAAMDSEQAQKEKLQKIKTRVIELMADAVRSDFMWNGPSPRRP